MNKHLASLWNEKDAFVLVISAVFGIDRVRVAVAEIDLLALLVWDALTRPRLHPAFHDAIFICGNAVQVSGMGKCARSILVLSGEKIIAEGDLLDQMRVRDRHVNLPGCSW